MQIGVVGLGRMGANIVRRLLAGGHECVVYNRSREPIEELAAEGATPAFDLDELARKLDRPRAAWIMVPAGDATEGMVTELERRFTRDDAIIDGGNSYFKDDVRRARSLADAGIHYVDVGTSGGVWGRERGYCLMIGGDAGVVKRLDPIFRCLAPGRAAASPTPGRQGRRGTAEEGYLHCGPSGAGHFVKMVHNGIEYGLMQAYAEGFDILRSAASPALPAEQRFTLDCADIAEVWRRGSVVGSWLLDLTSDALAEDPDLEQYTGFVPDSGEGRWTLLAAIEQAVPANVLSAALYARFRSRQDHTYADKMLSAMRAKFGGHAEKGTRQ